jgi:hypothetical protein
MPGHRVIAELDLSATDCGGPQGPVQKGNKSLLFVFEGLGGEDEGEVRFGAVIDRIRSGNGDPGQSMVAELWFWIELAAIYATSGVCFDLWYAGRTVGHGKVLGECGDFDDDLSD